MSYLSERRQEEKDRRRIEIIAAAESMYLQTGWDAVTMDSVARQARLSRALVYVYFKDKHELHLAIAVRAIHVLRARFEAAAAEAATGLQKIEALGRAYMAFAQEFPHYFDACARLEAQVPRPPATAAPKRSWQPADMHSAVCGASPDAAALPGGLSAGVDPRYAPVLEASRSVHEIVIEVLATGQRDGTIRDDIGDLAVTSRVLWGFTHGTIQIAITKAGPLTDAGIGVSQFTEHAVHLIRSMLAGPLGILPDAAPLGAPLHGTATTRSPRHVATTPVAAPASAVSPAPPSVSPTTPPDTPSGVSSAKDTP